jgi:hypothetical protein
MSGLTIVAFVMAVSSSGGAERSLRVDDPRGLELHEVKADAMTHRGRAALHVVEATPGAPARGPALVVLPGSELRNGVIETELAGAPRQGAPEGARGFVGLAFHVQGAGERYECFYLRPTNGRADDQLRRNHATQYISHPGYPWERLREENPGVYESYVDLVPAEWTRVRIEVEGIRARLFVNGATQPTLIVNDLKMGETGGRIGLWIGDGTEAWFSDVKVTPTAP